MKRGLIIIAAAIQFTLYGCGNALTVKVSNPLDSDRHPELVELNVADIQDRLALGEDEKFVIMRAGKEVPYQITYDDKVVFPVDLNAGETQTFRIRNGRPDAYTVQVCGAHYPMRVDDICWENDVVGFRTYGFKEDKPSGYDIFTKRNTNLPAIPEMYRKAFDPQMRKRHKELLAINRDSAKRFQLDSMTFHVDHGYGADFYAVGPTLGAGTAALLDGDRIIYPACYESFEILDNGPLRFTIRLDFKPFKIGDCDNIVETRLISLDLGSHFCKTVITFKNLDKVTPIVTGIVVQDTEGKAIGNTEKGYIAYPAPTMNFDTQREVDNGIIHIGNVFPEKLAKAGLTYFSEEESIARGGAKGHILAHAEYDPSKPFVYYWGFGWNFSDMETYDKWISHLDIFSAQLQTPHIVNLK